MNTRRILVIASAILIFFGCRSDKYIPDICFEENILPLFVTRCSMDGCHGGKEPEGDYVFTSYEGIMKAVVAGHPFRSKAYLAIRGKNPEMPPEGHTKLTREEVDRIKSWISFGAKNSAGCMVVCDTTSFTFSKDVKPILNTWCTGCHNYNKPGGGINLTDYSGVSVVVANGKLLGSIKKQSGYIPMPKNTAQLSTCKIKIVEKWIASGYPNN